MLPLLVLLFAAAPEASPNPGVPPDPLKEIGRVRALSPCSTMINRANEAISGALGNDRALYLLSSTLHRIDLDTEENPAKRRRAVDVFYRLIGAIKGSADEMRRRIAQLREQAATTTDPTQKLELNAFADALDAAVDRQKRAANEAGTALLKMVELSDEAEMAVLENPDTHGVPGNNSGSMHTAGVDASSRAKKMLIRRNTWNPKLRAAADVLIQRTKYITDDEAQAADHGARMTAGCQ
ncbi:MAG TPA: hypothetical protein VIW69_12750 [Candidatus Elarobacter sp.]